MADDLGLFLDTWRDFGQRVAQGEALTLPMDREVISRWGERGVSHHATWSDVIRDPCFGADVDRRLQLGPVPQPFMGNPWRGTPSFRRSQTAPEPTERASVRPGARCFSLMLGESIGLPCRSLRSRLPLPLRPVPYFQAMSMGVPWRAMGSMGSAERSNNRLTIDRLVYRLWAWPMELPPPPPARAIASSRPCSMPYQRGAITASA